MATDTSDRHWNWRLLSLGLGLLVGCCWALPAWAEETDTLASSRRTFHFVQQRQEQDANQDGDDAPVLPPTIVEEDEPEEEPAPEPPVPPATTPPPAPAPTSVLDGTIFDSPFQPPSVDGYAATTANSATLTNTPLIDVPQSVNVITEDILDDIQLFDVNQTFRFSSGVTIANPFGDLFSYNIRGFTTELFRWNGFRDNGLVLTTIDTANIQRIEFLKGPSSVLYGASEPGGFLNITTKKPFGENFTDVSISTGDHGLIRTGIDANRVLDEDGNILLRMNVALQSAESFRDFVIDDRVLIAPVLSLRLTDNTFLTFEAEYFDREGQSDSGILPIGGDIFALPRSRYLNDPTDKIRTENTRIAAYLDHSFNDRWAMRVATQYQDGERDVTETLPLPLVPLPETQVAQFSRRFVFPAEIFSAYAYLTGKFDLVGKENEVVFGAEFEDLQVNFSDNFTAGLFGAPFILDITNPVYQNNNAAPLVPAQARDQQATGVFFQDAMWLTDWLRVMGGTRYDSFQTNNAGAVGTVQDWTARGAVLAKVTENVSTWYSYTESFNSEFGFQFPTGDPLDPISGDQHEIGARWVDPNEQWTASAAIYEIERSNVPVASGVPGQSIQVGLARSRGIEFDFFGQLTDRTSLIANYAYTDVRTIEDSNPANIGVRFANIPYNIANVWLRHNLIDRPVGSCCDGPREVFGIGSGIVWESDERVSDAFPPRTETIPGFVRWDAGLYYQRGPLYSNLFLENVTDREYIVNANGIGYRVGNPFSVRWTAGARW